MNKEQFKEYRRNQHICYDYEEGYPHNRSEYFNKIPLQRYPRLLSGMKPNLIKAFAEAKKVIEWRSKPEEPGWRKEMVVVSHNNPHAAERTRRFIRNRYTYF